MTNSTEYNIFNAEASAPRLQLSHLLSSSGADPAEVIALRHRPPEPALRRAFPMLTLERPDLFEIYQAVQAGQVGRDILKVKYVLALVGLEAKAGTYAGFYGVGGGEPCNEGRFWSLPGVDELRSFGLVGNDADRPDQILIDLQPLPLWPEWTGKLTLDWPKPEIRWWRSASSPGFAVRSIVEENRFAAGMPEWDRLVLSWRELRVLPPTWRARLAEWRGVYFIYDAKHRQGYVGAAYGADNIMGRWLAYAQTGHGGNVALKDGQADDLRFSILERTSPDMLADDVIALESAWKNRLHTREFGLNRN